MNGVSDFGSEFVEVDPTGRYWRYNEILGKGSSKTVYRAFDEYEGIEVAWNQVKLCDFLQNPDDLERLYREIHLLKTLKHANIMKFYTSWVDVANRKINFVTEMFTSGTLRQYRLKHRRTNIRAIKNWCRQILQGLVYLHSQNPPIIHRDLKCDNIFINGNQGEVKIGDLGLAAILKNSHAARCVGTPEFMAPEVYEEEYNELVDIYSFGMCILEMLTFEYPYSECTHPAQIYKKVISGQKPDALYRIKDPEIRRFLGKCLATVSERHTAWELLNDPFLQIDDGCGYEKGSVLRQPPLSYSDSISHDQERELDPHPLDLFVNHEDDQLANVGVTVKGKRKEDGGIFLRIRIADQEGCIRNIHFPFDIQADTALSVATEMVAELDLIDQDAAKIGALIQDEIASMVPGWNREFVLEESPSFNTRNLHLDHHSPHRHAEEGDSTQRRRGSTIHGRFEEFTYMFDEAHASSSLSDEAESVTGIEGSHLDDQQSSPSTKTDTNTIEGLLSLQDLFVADEKEDSRPLNEGKSLLSGSNKKNEGSNTAASWAKGKVFPMLLPRSRGGSNLEVYS